VRALLQRVSEASVEVEGTPVSSIRQGLLVFLGVAQGDGPSEVEAMARKVAGLRLFEDSAGKMNLSNEEIGGEYLVVSQFTLLADLRQGKRPSFDLALRPPESETLYRQFCGRLAELSGRPVKTGTFGASMRVSLRNEGPATFVVEIPARGNAART